MQLPLQLPRSLVAGPLKARNAILAMIERRPVAGWPPLDLDPAREKAGAEPSASTQEYIAAAPWRVRTVSGFDRNPNLGYIEPYMGDVLVQINGEDVKPCTGGVAAFKQSVFGGAKQLAQGVLNGYAENMRRIESVPRPLFLTFERPAVYAVGELYFMYRYISRESCSQFFLTRSPSHLHLCDIRYATGATSHRLAEEGDLHAGAQYTMHITSEAAGVQFVERAASMVISGCSGLARVNPSPRTAAKTGGWVRDQTIAKATLAAMELNNGRDSAIPHSPMPTLLRLSNFSATIPACDRKGTSDPYFRVVTYALREGAGRVLAKLAPLVKSREAMELVKTEVQKKVTCPAEVSFPGAGVVEIPIGSAATRLTRFELQVLDYDKLSRNDKILTHSVDLTWMFSQTDIEKVVLRPDYVGPIDDQKANAGFTVDSVRLSFTAELVYGSAPPTLPSR